MKIRSTSFEVRTMRRMLALFALAFAGFFVVLRADDGSSASATASASNGSDAQLETTSSASTSPNSATDEQPAAIAGAPAAAASSTRSPAGPLIHPAGPVLDDRAIRDSFGAITVRPVPDKPAEIPEFIRLAEYMRSVHDNVGAGDYLKQVVTKGDVTPAARACAIVELADCLEAQHRGGEALMWLKIWMQLYPTRPEAGAVVYRIGAIYREMGLSDMARDAYYLSLAHSINEGQVNNADDLKQYSKLTSATLWAMAANEYDSGQWDRAAELFGRFRKEAPSASPISLEDSAFFQADCWYQLHQADKAAALYEATLKDHPFNPLAPQARLRLYHLDLIKGEPEKAGAELEALIWTVRTVWPKDEHYWQKQTAEVLLAVNKNNAVVLPPLVAGSSQMPAEGKSWQQTLHHYDHLAAYQAATLPTMDSFVPTPGSGKKIAGLSEEDELASLNHEINDLLPAADPTQ